MLLTEKRSDDLLRHNTTLNQKTDVLESKYQATVEELTQTIARSDLYKLQSEELTNECGALRVSSQYLLCLVFMTSCYKYSITIIWVDCC